MDNLKAPTGYIFKQIDDKTCELVKVENKRWKPTLNNSYFIVKGTGGLNSYVWLNDISDNNYYKVGNCFQTEEKAKESDIHFAYHSEYNYWHPGKPKPKELPEGCECYFNGKWREEIGEPKDWGELTRRWPKQ